MEGHEDQRLSTLKDIAQELGLPESTLRKYRDTYAHVIPYVGSGRERKYTGDAVEVFRMIRDCRESRHLSWEDTERMLINKFPVNAAEAGKKVAVGEEEGNLFLEKLERAVKLLSGQGQKQEFVLVSLAREFEQIRAVMSQIGPMIEDVKIMRRATYSYNEVVQRQFKESEKNKARLEEKLDTLQGSVFYIPEDVAKRVRQQLGALPARAEASGAVKPAAVSKPVEIRTAESKPADRNRIDQLEEQLRLKEAETEKFKELYIKAKREVERLQGELKRKTIDELYGPIPGADEKMRDKKGQGSTQIKGGKLFFRGKKPRED